MKVMLLSVAVDYTIHKYQIYTFADFTGIEPGIRVPVPSISQDGRRTTYGPLLIRPIVHSTGCASSPFLLL